MTTGLIIVHWRVMIVSKVVTCKFCKHYVGNCYLKKEVCNCLTPACDQYEYSEERAREWEWQRGMFAEIVQKVRTR